MRKKGVIFKKAMRKKGVTFSSFSPDRGLDSGHFPQKQGKSAKKVTFYNEKKGGQIVNLLKRLLFFSSGNEKKGGQIFIFPQKRVKL